MAEPHEATGPRELDRRAFLALMGAASLAGALPKSAGAAAAAADTTTHAAAPAAPSADAQALAGVLRRRFGDRLDEAQWESVTRALDARLDSGRRLREHRLANGDEPDFAFRP